MRGTVLAAADREELAKAVAEVERASGAELVPVVADRSDDYRVADWRGALAGALAGAVAHAALPELFAWSAWGRLMPLAWAATGALAGALAARVPALRRALAGDRETKVRVGAAARAAFLDREVFRTRDRTGLLIYVSRFERRVEVVADEAVYRAVPPEVWQRVADETAGAMRGTAPAAAMLVAIRRAGELVGEFGPRRRSDDVNELPDAPVER